MPKLLAGVLLAAVLAVWHLPRGDTTGALATVWFFDVGQGDAALVGTPAGYQILIDGGPDDSVLHGLGKAMPFGDKTIDAVMLSHPHADHYRGLQRVFERYQVSALWVSVEEQDSAEYRNLLETVRRRGAAVRHVTSGANIAIPGVGSADVLYPIEPIAGRRIKNLNDASLIVKVTVAGTTVLFPGDAEVVEENALVRAGVPLDADILKAGHHGSKTSSQADFVEAVSPATSVISVGADNRYRHPASQTIGTLQAYGPVYRTDQQGTVTLRIGPAGYHIGTER